ncbi:hypothetical protein D9M68_571710 [compost metagenome]
MAEKSGPPTPIGPMPAIIAMLAPGRVSPSASAPRLTTLARSSCVMWRPADTSSVPGPATCRFAYRMSRPACTSDTSRGSLFTISASVPTMSRPARMRAGAAERYQVSGAGSPLACTLRAVPLARPRMSPRTA